MTERNNALNVPMLFLRTGWMKRYDGQNELDRVIGGGKFVEENDVGFEMYNFRPIDNKVYGYVRPVRGSRKHTYDDGAGIKLQKIDKLQTGKFMSGVLIVWIATKPITGGAYIVGWYKNASVFRSCQKSTNEERRKIKVKTKYKYAGYYTTADYRDATLLSVSERNFHIPKQKGHIGHSNVWYAKDPKHRELQIDFRQKVLDFISKYRKPATHPSRGVPRQPDPELRTKIEHIAMDVTASYFETERYRIVRCYKDNHGWDLEAHREGDFLRLEVKGLSGTSVCVELTPNEYRQMMSHRLSYCICIVTNALSSNPTLSIFTYCPDSTRWKDKNNRKLKIKELTSARCYL